MAVALYKSFTSLPYKGEEQGEIEFQLSQVMIFFKDQARLFGLMGDMEKVHSAVIPEQLLEMDPVSLAGWAKLFHVDVTGDTKEMIVSKIMRQKIWQVEMLQYHQYLERVLWSRDKAPFRGYLQMFKAPLPMDVLGNGPSMYYFRVGEMTYEKLMERYTFFELFHMASRLALAQQDPDFDLSNYTKADVVHFVLAYVDQLQLDPRWMVTMFDIVDVTWLADGDVFLNIHPQKNFDRAQVASAASRMGLNMVDKPLTQVYTEYVMELFLPQFWLEPPQGVRVLDVVWSGQSASGIRIDNLEYGQYVLYGVGDGVSKMIIYTLSELIHTFETFGVPYRPDTLSEDMTTWGIFSPSSLRRLLRLLPKLERDNPREVPRLVTAIQQVLQTSWGYEKRQETLLQHVTLDVQSVFNLCLQIADLQNLEQINGLEYMFKMQLNTPDVTYTDHMREQVVKLVRDATTNMLDNTGLGDLRMVWFYANAYHTDWNGDTGTLYGVVRLMSTFAQMGMLTPVIYLAGQLALALNKYSVDVKGQNLVSHQFYWEPDALWQWC